LYYLYYYYTHLYRCFVRLYRIVVETRSRPTSSHRSGRSISPPPSSTPCNLTHAQLLNHHQATLAGASCYVAAEMPRERIIENKRFVVGDNRTYGGYYNSPLKMSNSYIIWFGLVVTIDGVSGLYLLNHSV